MVEVSLGEAATFEDGFAFGLGKSRNDYPERLATGVGVDHRHPLPAWRWLVGEGSGEVHLGEDRKPPIDAAGGCVGPPLKGGTTGGRGGTWLTPRRRSRWLRRSPLERGDNNEAEGGQQEAKGGQQEAERDNRYHPLVTTVADVLASLAETIRPETAAAWDPVGLQIGDPDAKVDRMGVCHEVTEDVVSAMETAPVDLLISYHPLLFAPVNRLLEGRSPASRAVRLVRARVNVVVAHTDFDAAPGGAADSLAKAVGLANPTPFGADEDEGVPDVGRVGDYQGSLGDLVEVVTRALGSPTPRVSGNISHPVSRVAVVPGSGSDFISQAGTLAEALITGDVGHHKAVTALDAGLAVIDPGHIATERPGMASLVGMIRSLAGVEVVDLTDLDPQTWV